MSSSASEEILIEQISGMKEFIEWNGFLPSFHDNEVMDIFLNRADVSKLRIHAWQSTDEKDENGYFRTLKHAIVTFTFKNIVELELAEFNNQNVMEGLEIRKQDDYFELEIYGCYGICGLISSEEISITFEPVEENSIQTRY